LWRQESWLLSEQLWKWLTASQETGYWGNHSQWVCCNQEISNKMMLNNSLQEPKMSRDFKDLKRCITTKPYRSDQCLMKSPYTERNIWMWKYSLSVLVEHCPWPMLPEDHENLSMREHLNVEVQSSSSNWTLLLTNASMTIKIFQWGEHLNVELQSISSGWTLFLTSASRRPWKLLVEQCSFSLNIDIGDRKSIKS